MHSQVVVVIVVANDFTQDMQTHVFSDKFIGIDHSNVYSDELIILIEHIITHKYER